jgi:hypothetical protein
MSVADIITPRLFAPLKSVEAPCNCIHASSNGTPVITFGFCVPIPNPPALKWARDLALPTARATIIPCPRTYTTISAVVAATRRICGGCIGYSLAIGLVAVLSGRLCWGCGGAGLVDLTRDCGAGLAIYDGSERCRSICSHCLSRVAWSSSDGREKRLGAGVWGRAVEASELRTLRSCLEPGSGTGSSLALYDVTPDFIACAERAIKLNEIGRVQPVSGFPLVAPPLLAYDSGILQRSGEAPARTRDHSPAIEIWEAENGQTNGHAFWSLVTLTAFPFCLEAEAAHPGGRVQSQRVFDYFKPCYRADSRSEMGPTYCFDGMLEYVARNATLTDVDFRGCSASPIALLWRLYSAAVVGWHPPSYLYGGRAYCRTDQTYSWLGILCDGYDGNDPYRGGLGNLNFRGLSRPSDVCSCDCCKRMHVVAAGVAVWAYGYLNPMSRGVPSYWVWSLTLARACAEARGLDTVGVFDERLGRTAPDAINPRLRERDTASATFGKTQGFAAGGEGMAPIAISPTAWTEDVGHSTRTRTWWSWHVRGLCRSARSRWRRLAAPLISRRMASRTLTSHFRNLQVSVRFGCSPECDRRARSFGMRDALPPAPPADILDCPLGRPVCCFCYCT